LETLQKALSSQHHKRRSHKTRRGDDEADHGAGAKNRAGLKFIGRGHSHNDEGKRIGEAANEHRPDNYPEPIIDEKKARNFAAQAFYGLRRSGRHRAESDRIVTKHGSRRSPAFARQRQQNTKPVQQEFDL
jgi:hypothetical protein